jgi:hypothetical protein
MYSSWKISQPFRTFHERFYRVETMKFGLYFYLDYYHLTMASESDVALKKLMPMSRGGLAI